MNYDIKALKSLVDNNINLNLEQAELNSNVATETVDLTANKPNNEIDPTKYVMEKGYMLDSTNGSFNSEGKVTRAYMAQVLYNMAGKPEVTPNSTYSDVTNSAWYSKAITWATENGIVSGYDDGTFNPNAELTNEQALAMLRKYGDYKDLDVNAYVDISKYSDASSVSPWARDTMSWAVDNWVYKGDTLNPQGVVTRGDLASYITGFETTYANDLAFRAGKINPILSGTTAPKIDPIYDGIDEAKTSSTTSQTTEDSPPAPSVSNQEENPNSTIYIGETEPEEVDLNPGSPDSPIHYGETPQEEEPQDNPTETVHEEVVPDDTVPTNPTYVEVEYNPSDDIVHQKTFKQSREYSDVSVEDMAVVNYVSEKGYMVGMSDTTFNPNVNLTRAQMVQALYSASGKPKISSNSQFTDVHQDDWYYDAVTWAKQSGIVGGYDNGAFGPDDVLTNEQMVAIMRKYADYNGYDISSSGNLNGYYDASDVSNYAKDSMSWAIDNNLYETTRGGLNPKRAVSRIEFARLITNFDNHYDRTNLYDSNGETNNVQTNENKETANLNTNAERIKDPLKTYDTKIPYKSTQSEREAYVRNAGYMVGDDTGFNPNGQVTRAQMVQVLYAKEGYPNKGNATFRDVESDKWYADAVSWAKTNGIVGGFEDGTFRPDEAITNEQMMTIMKAYATYKRNYTGASSGTISSIKNTVDSHEYSVESLAWAYENKLFNDSKVNSLYDIKAKNIATRDDMAGLLMGYDRAFDKDKYNNIPKTILTKDQAVKEGIYRVNSVSERFKAYDDVYKTDAYGATQDEPKNLFVKYSSEEALYQDNSISGQKAQILNEVIKNHYPETDLKQRLDIAKVFSNRGCNYTAVAQSFMLSILEQPNGEQMFERMYGFSPYVTDGNTKELNITAVAMDMMLDRYKYLSYDEFLDKARGTNYEYDHYKEYFNSKNIGYSYEIAKVGDFNIGNQNTYSKSAVNDAFEKIYNYSNKHPKSVYVACGWDYDLNAMKSDNYIDINTYNEMQSNLRGTNNYKEVPAHSVSVTGYVDDNIIVSSWGSEYALPIQQSFKNDGTTHDTSGETVYPELRIAALDFDFTGIGGVR